MPREATPLLSCSTSARKEKDDREAQARIAQTKLRWACACAIVFMIAEIIGGFMAGSLSIMTDAAHLLSDVAGYLVSIFSIWVASLPASARMSYGFRRAEVLGAMISVVFIWILTASLMYSAVRRLVEDLGDAAPPARVNGRLMFLVALIGFGVNLLMMKILGHHHHHHDHEHDDHDHNPKHEHHVNVHAAYIHAMGDLVQSLGVCVAGALIWYNPRWQIADPIATMVFSVMVLCTTTSVVKRSIHVLMEGTPEGINPADIESGLRALPSIEAVHDLHIWSLTIGMPSLSVHVVSNDTDAALHESQDYLMAKGIEHTTIQVERVSTKYPRDCSIDHH